MAGCLDFRRQKVAVLATTADDAAMTVPDAGPTPLEAVESRELAQRLVTAVEALPLEEGYRGSAQVVAAAG